MADPNEGRLTVRDAEVHAQWELFLREYYKDDLPRVVLESKPSLVIDFALLQLRSPELANLTLRKPNTSIPIGQEALRKALEDHRTHDVTIPTDQRIPLESVRLAIGKLPPSLFLTPRQLNAAHLGQLVPVRGIVTACSPVLFEELEACFECKVCTTQVRVPQLEETRSEPVLCETCDAERPWRHVPEQGKITELQILRLQELPEALEGGQVPETLSVRFNGDLVQAAPAGSRVIVTGILGLKYRRVNGRITNEAESVLEAVHVEQDQLEIVDLESTDEELARFQVLARRPDIHVELAKCIAPSVMGLDDVKMGVLYGITGAPKVVELDGSEIHGRPHNLIVGDPGVAKSKLLGTIRNYVPRCISVYGLGTNRVGLGAGVVKDESSGQWLIEPGALVLAHKHVLVLDELGLIEDEDHPALNSAMAEGRVPVTKIKKGDLPAECLVIAAMNPQTHRFDAYTPFLEQLGLHPALRSRFDLIWCLRDVVDKKRDRELAHRQMSPPAKGASVKDHYGLVLDADEVRRYIHQARQIDPAMTTAARDLLTDYYDEVRQSDKDNPPFTPRQLDALKRLACASARLRFSLNAELEDAERSIDLMQASLRSCKVIDGTGRVDGSLLQFGKSKSQADRVRMVIQVIKDVMRKSPLPYNKACAGIDDVIAAGQDLGIDEQAVRDTVAALLRNATIYQRGGAGQYAILSP